MHIRAARLAAQGIRSQSHLVGSGTEPPPLPTEPTLDYLCVIYRCVAGACGWTPSGVAGVVTKPSVSVCRNATMSLSSWAESPRLPIKVVTFAGVSGGGQQLTFSP